MTLSRKNVPIPRPDVNFAPWWIWPLLLAIFSVAGFFITLIINNKKPIGNELFLLGAAGLPFLVWLITFTASFSWYLFAQKEVDEHNMVAQERYEAFVDYEQQPLHVLYHYFQCGLGSNSDAQGNVAEKVSKNTLTPQDAANGKGVESYTLLSLPESNNIKRIDLLFADLHKQISENISPSIIQSHRVEVHFVLDVLLPQEHVLDAWHKRFGSSYQFAEQRVISAQESLELLGDWLDDSVYGRDLLLIVALNLFAPSVKEGQAEMMTAMLLNGVNPLENGQSSESGIVAIHRPQSSNDLLEALEFGLLTGSPTPISQFDTVWLNKIAPEDNAQIFTHLHDQSINTQNICHIDNAIGHSGSLSYWSAVGLAIEQTKYSKEKQLIVCKDEQFSTSVVSYVNA